MSATSADDLLKRNYKLCLIAHLVSIFLMFGSALLMGSLSRRYGVVAVGDSEPSLLISTHIAAMRLALFVGLPAFVIAISGMLRYQSWARRLFAFLIITWAVQIAGFGFFNLPLTWGLSGLFTDLALLTSGAVLAMTYLTPIAGLFTHTRSAVSSPEATELSPA